MSRILSDPTVHKAMREFIVCLNRVENAEARGADGRMLDNLQALARTAAQAVEDTLVERGWSAPGTSPAPTLRVPDAVPAVISL